MNRFSRAVCIFLTMLISFSLLCEIAPVTSDASAVSEDVISEESLTDDLFDEAAKKTTKKKTPTTVPYTNPEGAELTYRVLTDKGWDKDYTAQGKVAGKPGKGLGIQAVEIGIKSDIEGKVCCRVYLEDTGWTGQAGNFEIAGNDRDTLFIVTGGNMHKDGEHTEAGFMAELLKERGVSEDRIIIEDQAENTFHNLEISAGMIEESVTAGILPEPSERLRLGIVTAGFHIPRTRMMAADIPWYDGKDIVFIRLGE